MFPSWRKQDEVFNVCHLLTFLSLKLMNEKQSIHSCSLPLCLSLEL